MYIPIHIYRVYTHCSLPLSHINIYSIFEQNKLTVFGGGLG